MRMIVIICVIFREKYTVILFLIECSASNSVLNYFVKKGSVVDHLIADLGLKGILGVGTYQNENKSINYLFERHSGGPIFPHKWQTDTPTITNIRMINFLQTTKFRRINGIILRKLQWELQTYIVIRSFELTLCFVLWM